MFLCELILRNFFSRYPIENVLFVTLTFAQDVRSTKVAHDRINSLLNKVRDRGWPYIWFLEPQASGRIHYHLLLAVSFDARDGTNLDAWKNRREYTDAERREAMNPALRIESDWWEEKAKTRHFGRIEVAPIYSDAEAIGKYLLKQDWRQRHWPFQEKKYVRFWNCSQRLKSGTSRFSWETPNGRQWRKIEKAWAFWQGCHSREELKEKVGPHWGFHLLQDVETAEFTRQYMIETARDYEGQTLPKNWPSQLRQLQFLFNVFPDCSAVRSMMLTILNHFACQRQASANPE